MILELNSNKLSFDRDGAEELLYLIRKTLAQGDAKTTINFVEDGESFSGTLYTTFIGERK